MADKISRLPTSRTVGNLPEVQVWFAMRSSCRGFVDTAVGLGMGSLVCTHVNNSKHHCAFELCPLIKETLGL